MIIKPLPLNEHQHYEELCQQYGSIFSSLNWLKLNDGIKFLGIYNADKKLIGGFHYQLQKSGGIFNFIKTPTFTPHCGLFFENKASNPANALSFQKNISQAIVDYLKQLKPAITSLFFPPETNDMQPFIWAKYKVIPNYTYHHSLKNNSEESIWNSFSPERRNDIKKAIKDGVETKICTDMQTVYDLVMKSLNRNEVGISDSLLRKILFEFANETNSFAFVSMLNNRPIAVAFCIHDTKTAYYLLGGYDQSYKHQGAGANAVWNAIQHSLKIGLTTFDFEGSMLPPVEKYFRGFGGQLVPYYSINKAWLPIEMILKIVKRERF